MESTNNPTSFLNIASQINLGVGKISNGELIGKLIQPNSNFYFKVLNDTSLKSLIFKMQSITFNLAKFPKVEIDAQCQNNEHWRFDENDNIVEVVNPPVRVEPKFKVGDICYIISACNNWMHAVIACRIVALNGYVTIKTIKSNSELQDEMRMSYTLVQVKAPAVKITIMESAIFATSEEAFNAK